MCPTILSRSGRLLLLSCGLLAAGTAQAYVPGSRKPYDFKTFFTTRSLSQAQLMFQAENDLLGQRTTQFSTGYTYTQNYNSTTAESLTTMTLQCGNDTSCLIDALFNREGSGSLTSSVTPNGTSVMNANTGGPR